MKTDADLPIDVLRQDLLAWYDDSGRSLPWRLRPEDRAAGKVANSYSIWLSEIMLQQTTVPHATPYWFKFLDRWPTIHDLAMAYEDDVFAAWAGLGYYARARNLMACARVISENGGTFPTSETDLLKLPGIGPYTAAAIRAAAFNLPASVVDGNVERVIARLCALPHAVKKSKPLIKRIAAALASPDRPGDYAQAIMDLGATICTPRSPSCETCPWQHACTAFAVGDVERYPVKSEKVDRPVRYGVGFAVFRGGHIWLRKRPARGLLGGMLEVPSTDWRATGWTKGEAEAQAPFATGWKASGEITHVFTHFTLKLQIWRCAAAASWQPETGQWYPVDQIDALALPSVMKKAIRAAL
jgi:A/G-specific adenine glycosylase